MSITLTQHIDTVVRPLAKKGEDILLTLTPTKAHLLHMGAALIGEGIECIISDPEDHKNGIQELGDVAFYLSGIAMALEYTPNIKTFEQTETLFEEMLNNTGEAINIGIVYLSSLNVIFNRIKKYTIYDKQMDILEELKEPLDKAYSLTLYLAKQFFGLSLEDVFAANCEKLLTGEKARYASGQYSDQQAVERADTDGVDSE
jgi:hypothetical protein